MKRLILIIICLLISIGLSIYGQYNPPVKKILISDWFRKAKENDTFIPYISVKLKNILSDGKVIMMDNYGDTINCQIIPGTGSHIKLKREKNYKVELMKVNDRCYIKRFEPLSKYRIYKILISIFALFIVIIIFLKDYRFYWKGFIIIKRDKNA